MPLLMYVGVYVCRYKIRSVGVSVCGYVGVCVSV